MGWRMGYVAAPHEITAQMHKIHQYAIMCAPTVAQEAALDALRNGREAMLRMRDSYRERRDFFVGGLNAANLNCLLPQGAFYAFPSVAATGLSSEEFAKRLLEDQRVAVVPGTAFGAGGEGFVRCCYATGRDELKEALERIGKFLKKLGR